MSRGFSINIGLNRIDPNHYGGDGALAGCVFDANDMADIARSRGFQNPTILLDEQATAEAVSNAIADAAQRLQGGDTLFISYSGHGGQVTDSNGDEGDGDDETWCLYNRQFIDDELFALWTRFAAGVRIFVVSDSCHSGTVTRMALYEDFAKDDYADGGGNGRIKTLSRATLRSVYERNRELYEEIQKNSERDVRAVVKASVLLISGCQDWQLSSDGDRNGLFTEKLREVWDNGSFQGNYIKFHQHILAKLPDRQQPNYYKTGMPSVTFETQKPFTI